MSRRDPEDKKSRLLDSALTAFAAKGLAGARVDEIAGAAACSVGLVYSHFGSKEALFDAVLDHVTQQVITQTAIKPSNLGEYASQLYEDAATHPEIGRFAAWHQLERRPGAVRDAVALATQHDISAIQAAQEAGEISDRVPAGELLVAIQAIARMWLTLPAEVVEAAEPTNSHRYRARAVRRVVDTLLR
ncbi:TetR family transcriptional regulator [Solicola sp. PLA-1-18]|uniref:TetR family transcriptional regulator n=1 Tax=Solicola sp. PLA-1-18 TaxID=3380532 RepID=UPI003B7A6420